MTFQTLDDLMRFLDQVAADGMRAFETAMLLRDPDEIDYDIAEVIDGCRAWHDEQMAAWWVETRRQLAELPLRFPLTVTWEDARARQQRAGGAVRLLHAAQDERSPGR